MTLLEQLEADGVEFSFRALEVEDGSVPGGVERCEDLPRVVLPSIGQLNEGITGEASKLLFAQRRR